MWNMFAMIFKCFSGVQVFQTHVSSVSPVFFCMLQLLHLDIFINRSGVAHGMHLAWKVAGGVGDARAARAHW
jgi:hypothetical protein